MKPEELRERRQAMRLTQEQLAERLGVGRMAVYYWERGANPISRVVELALERLEQRKEQVEKHMVKRVAIDPANSEMLAVSVPLDQWVEFSSACLIRGLKAEEQLDTLMRDFARTVKREEMTLGGVLEERINS